MSLADVLRVARADLGYTESPAGSNRQKYGAAAGWDGVAWCAQACWWVWREAGHDVLPRTASVEVMWRHARDNGWVVNTPAVGDIPVFDFPRGPVFDHVGIVVTRVINAHTFLAIEGNTSPDDRGSQSNGGGVFERRRVLHQTHGFIRPPIEEDDVPLTAADLSAIEAVVRRAAGPAVWAHGFPLTDGPNPPVETAGIRLVQAARGGGLAASVAEILAALEHGTPVTISQSDVNGVADAVIDRLGPALAAQLAAAVTADIARRFQT